MGLGFSGFGGGFDWANSSMAQAKMAGNGRADRVDASEPDSVAGIQAPCDRLGWMAAFGGRFVDFGRGGFAGDEGEGVILAFVGF